MKKNLFFGLFATMVLLLTTACQKENDLLGIGEATISFEISTPQMATRAFSDGTTAKVLKYAVYHKDGEGYELLREVGTAELDGKKAHVDVQLATGKTYSVLFWAQADGAPFNLHYNDLTMEVIYNDATKCNDENYDAFYWFDEVEVNGAATVGVTLKRPFAQLNIGTNDLENIDDVSVKKTAVTVENVYNTFNFASGNVQGTATSVTFTSNDRPAAAETFPVSGYKYLAMNYILVQKEGEVLNEVILTYDNGNKSRSFTNIPVKANHRTNIYGALLTNNIGFDVDIDNSFDNEDDMTNVTVFSAQDLQAAIDAAPVGKTTTIILGANIKGDVIEYQKADRGVIIEGNGNKYDGTIKIHNGSSANNGTITIKNVNFETSTPELNFIMPNDFGVENGVTRRYSNNVTVENCTFTATGEAVNTVVGVQAKSSKNLQVLNCTATNVHSLIQAQSCDEDVIVRGATINGKNGVAFKQVKNAVVEGTTITATGYGIRFDGNTDNYGITATDNTITAVQPFIVRKMTGKDNTIALEGENTLTVSAASISTEAPAYQIVITNGSDDEAYVKPTGTYTLTGADNYLVYPRDVFVGSWDEFTAALTDGAAGIVLTGDITYDANYQLQKDVTIDLNGKSMTLPMINIHKNVTIKNGTINGKVYARTNSEIVFNKVTFSGAVSDNLSTEGHLAIQGGCKSLYAKDCLFSPTSVSGSQTKPLSFEGGSTIMKFENCEFKSSPYKKQVYFNSLSATAKLDFTNCNFNNKTPNIMFAAACPLTNLTMSGTTKLSSVTLETNRAKDTVTEVEWAHISSLIANNKFTRVRVFYTGGSSEYIK